jgi:hypothetical protein
MKQVHDGLCSVYVFCPGEHCTTGNWGRGCLSLFFPCPNAAVPFRACGDFPPRRGAGRDWWSLCEGPGRCWGRAASTLWSQQHQGRSLRRPWLTDDDRWSLAATIIYDVAPLNDNSLAFFTYPFSQLKSLFMRCYKLKYYIWFFYLHDVGFEPQDGRKVPSSRANLTTWRGNDLHDNKK